MNTIWNKPIFNLIIFSRKDNSVIVRNTSFCDRLTGLNVLFFSCFTGEKRTFFYLSIQKINLSNIKYILSNLLKTKKNHDLSHKKKQLLYIKFPTIKNK